MANNYRHKRTQTQYNRNLIAVTDPLIYGLPVAIRYDLRYTNSDGSLVPIKVFAAGPVDYDFKDPLDPGPKQFDWGRVFPRRHND